MYRCGWGARVSSSDLTWVVGVWVWVWVCGCGCGCVRVAVEEQGGGGDVGERGMPVPLLTIAAAPQTVKLGGGGGGGSANSSAATVALGLALPVFAPKEVCNPPRATAPSHQATASCLGEEGADNPGRPMHAPTHRFFLWKKVKIITGPEI